MHKKPTEIEVGGKSEWESGWKVMHCGGPHTDDVTRRAQRIAVVGRECGAQGGNTKWKENTACRMLLTIMPRLSCRVSYDWCPLPVYRQQAWHEYGQWPKTTKK